VITFTQSDDPSSGMSQSKCRWDWSPAEPFESISVVAVDVDTDEEIAIKTLLHNVNSSPVPLDARKLVPGHTYRYEVYGLGNGKRKKIDNDSLSGDRVMQVPFQVGVYYHIERARQQWSKVHIVVDGDLPWDSLVIVRNRQSYYLPRIPAKGEVLVLNFRAEVIDQVSVKSLVNISRRVNQVDTIAQLMDYAKESVL